MRLLHARRVVDAVFDDANLVSCAGLVARSHIRSRPTNRRGMRGRPRRRIRPRQCADRGERARSSLPDAAERSACPANRRPKEPPQRVMVKSMRRFESCRGHYLQGKDFSDPRRLSPSGVFLCFWGWPTVSYLYRANTC